MWLSCVTWFLMIFQGGYLIKGEFLVRNYRDEVIERSSTSVIWVNSLQIPAHGPVVVWRCRNVENLVIIANLWTYIQGSTGLQVYKGWTMLDQIIWNKQFLNLLDWAMWNRQFLNLAPECSSYVRCKCNGIDWSETVLLKATWRVSFESGYLDL